MTVALVGAAIQEHACWGLVCDRRDNNTAISGRYRTGQR